MKPSTLSLDQVVPGMRLGTDVSDAVGTVLLASGCELNESLLAALRGRGIREVEVMVEEAYGEPEREARRKAILARLTHLFRHLGQTDADRQLFEIVRDYRLEQLE